MFACCSHIDTFDPKPELNELAGQKLPLSFKPVVLSKRSSATPRLSVPIVAVAL